MTIAITRVIIHFEVGVIYRFTFHSIDRKREREREPRALHMSSQGFGTQIMSLNPGPLK